jgi:hypothetical protein
MRTALLVPVAASFALAACASAEPARTPSLQWKVPVQGRAPESLTGVPAYPKSVAALEKLLAGEAQVPIQTGRGPGQYRSLVEASRYPCVLLLEQGIRPPGSDWSRQRFLVDLQHLRELSRRDCKREVLPGSSVCVDARGAAGLSTPLLWQEDRGVVLSEKSYDHQELPFASQRAAERAIEVLRDAARVCGGSAPATPGG